MDNLTIIGIFGAVNSGKSTLFNQLINQELAIVSATAGTTTDSVSKLIELGELGRVKLIDTAGLGDTSKLGEQRMSSMYKVARTVDIAIIVHIDDDDGSEDLLKVFDAYKTPHVEVINAEIVSDVNKLNYPNAMAIKFSKIEDIARLLDKLNTIKRGFDTRDTLTGNLVGSGDTVLLVMPQDQSAPDGRLILPQSQTIRELLDKRCTIISCVKEELTTALDALKHMPSLVIADSSVFDYVYNNIPKGTRLTSFSVLFAKLKGDIDVFLKGAESLDSLNGNSKILIAEACSHTPKNEDIGRVKIPNLLRKRYGEGITIDIVNGLDFPINLAQYDLIIHCGACMFTKKTVLNRVIEATKLNVPITNYGIALAKLNGILDKITFGR